MQRRDFIKLSAIAGVTLTCNPSANAAENKLPRFAVLSDTHFGGGGKQPKINNQVQKIANTLKNILGKGKIDALFVVGDLTDNGRAEQFDLLLKVFKDESIVPASQRVIFMMGNHEYYNKEDPIANYSKLGQPLHQYIDIKGIPFITISHSSHQKGEYDAEAQKFLSDHLAEAAKKYPGKPIFVFAHYPPSNTSYGSKSWGTRAFPFLKDYPQVVFFSGHTHTPIGDPRMIWQDTFTSINDGSVFYACVEKNEIDDGTGLRKGANVNEALIVNVKTGTMLDIERWDTFHNEEILPQWNVDWKNKNYKDRDGKPAPAFADGAAVSVKVEGKGCAVTFPQAKDNEIVFRYIVEIKDGEKVIKTAKPSSQFFLNREMPKEIAVSFKDLPAGGKLTATVKALDSYDNASAVLVSEAFTC